MYEFSDLVYAASPTFEQGVQEGKTVLGYRLERHPSLGEFMQRCKQPAGTEARAGHQQKADYREHSVDLLGTLGQISTEQKGTFPFAVDDVVADQATIFDEGYLAKLSRDDS